MNFKHIKDYDITDIKTYIESVNDEWLENTYRQTKFKRPHGNTNSIIVTSFPDNWDGNKYPITVNKINIYELIKPIVVELETLFGGKVGKAMFAKLSANKNITIHKDCGYYLNSVHRCHIPIITNEQVMFTVGDETISMKYGSCVEIDNNIDHGVMNNSDQDRVHLIIDIIPLHAFK